MLGRMAPQPRDPSPTPEAETPRAGRVALVGRPNVGKSTLLNAALGQKLAIATPTPGTTRTCLLGVYASDEPPTQIAFIDTPGLHRPKSALGRVLREQAALGLEGSDAVVMMIEVPRGRGAGTISEQDAAVLELVQAAGRPTVLVINKVDLVRDKSRLLPLIDAVAAQLSPEAVVPVSALRGTNLDALLAELRALLPEGRLYDDGDDVLTDRPERFFVAELLREAAIAETRAEVPHGLACVIDTFEERGGLVRIEATIVVEKESHKGIVIGARGARLKAIGTAARGEMERLLERKVFLKLWVKVMPKWTANPAVARRLATEVEQP